VVHLSENVTDTMFWRFLDLLGIQFIKQNSKL